MDLSSKLGAAVEACVGEILGTRRRIALVDFPNYRNFGDSAIWYGEETLAQILRLDVVYRCTTNTFAITDLRRRQPEVIVINGGGNLGDTWPRHQLFRERLLAEAPDLPVVQLPQSMHFSSSAAFERAKRAFGAHNDLTVLLRDDVSFERARAQFDCSVKLCPDMAFVLQGRLGTSRESSHHRVVGLVRSDHEADGGLLVAARERNVFVTDWPVAERAIERWRPRRKLHNFRLRVGCSEEGYREVPFHQYLTRSYLPLSRASVKRAVGILGSGVAIVTNRLHAHILAEMLGIPHVAVDTTNGKISAFHRTWFTGSPLAHLAPTAPEACDLAITLANAGRL